MAAQDESPTVQVEETQYDDNKEPYVEASQPNPQINESPPTAQGAKTPSQLMTPATPRTKATEQPETPLGPASNLPTQLPERQSPSQESDDVPSEISDDEPEEESRAEKKESEEPHTLPAFDWEGLEKEYFSAMERANEVEADLSEEFKTLANYFAQWSDVSLARDEERAVKRFRTRQMHVYHSEDGFATKKQHYETVVTAFKSAMALLQSD
ncbi:hypothetical protein V494_05324 [Pseudogymnoascus sp. VKM F-4513 (FW-928)]|nr:hypothetical protein V494_05324 [Pseudogymnoascus sp. VKM F-4513 (FW-928)]